MEGHRDRSVKQLHCCVLYKYKLKAALCDEVRINLLVSNHLRSSILPQDMLDSQIMVTNSHISTSPPYCHILTLFFALITETFICLTEHSSFIGKYLERQNLQGKIF